MRGLLTARETDVSSIFRLYLTVFMRKYPRVATLYLLLSICVYVCPSTYTFVFIVVCTRFVRVPVCMCVRLCA